MKTYLILEKEIRKYIKDSTQLKKIRQSYECIKTSLNLEYILSVLETLIHIESDYITLCSGLLYKEEIVNEELYDKEILNIVKEIKKINNIKININKDNLSNYYKNIIIGLIKEPRVIVVKLADLLEELKTTEQKKQKAIEATEIFAPIASHLGIHYIKSQLEDLSLKHLKPEIYKDIEEKLFSSQFERDKNIENMILDISKILKTNKIKHEIIGRSKNISSIYKKLDKGRTFDDIYDILALRIFVNTKNDCYSVLGLLHSNYNVVPKRFKDYIARPKKNMYQSLHTTVFGINKLLYEIQIRTYEMDKIAEHGFAAHWAYKEKKEINSTNFIEQKLQMFRNIIETDDTELIETFKAEFEYDQIYVYTPKGDIIQLPKCATPIDFAYRVHSAIGDTMTGALVNDIMVPLDYELKESDIVKIITNKNTKPSKEWLKIAKTTQAKSRIRSFYTKIDKDINIEKGKDLLDKELRKKKIPYSDFYTDENIEKILKDLNEKEIEDVYLFIGTNKYTPSTLINLVFKEEKDKEELILSKIKKSDVKNDNKRDIIVANIDQIKLNLANCCTPIKGDEIIGIITKEKGVSVHRKECLNAIHNEKTIDVKWNENSKNKYVANLIIRTNKKENFLLKLISKASTSNISIKNINTTNNKDTIVYKIQVLVDDKEILTKFINDIYQLKDVLFIERTIE